MAESDLDRLVAQWDAVNWPAAAQYSATRTPEQPAFSPDLQAATQARTAFLETYPQYADKLQTLIDGRYPGALKSVTSRFQKFDSGETSLGYKAALAGRAALVPGSRFLKSYSFGLVDPIRWAGAQGEAQRFESSIAGEAVSGAASLLGMVSPGGAVSAVTKGARMLGGAFRAARGASAAARAAPAAEGLLTQIGKEAATWATAAGTEAAVGVGTDTLMGNRGPRLVRRHPTDRAQDVYSNPRSLGATVAGAAGHAALGAVVIGAGGRLGGGVAKGLLKDSTVGPWAERAARGLGAAVGMGAGSAVLAPAGERKRQAIIGTVIGGIVGGVHRSTAGQRAYDAETGRLSKAYKAANVKLKTARQSGNKTEAHAAMGEQQTARSDLLDHRRNRELSIAYEDNPNIRAIVDNAIESGVISEATQALRSANTRLNELAMQRKATERAAEDNPDLAEQAASDLKENALEVQRINKQAGAWKLAEMADALKSADVDVAAGGKLHRVAVTDVRVEERRGKRFPVAEVIMPDTSKRLVHLGALRVVDPNKIAQEKQNEQDRVTLDNMRDTQPDVYEQIINPPASASKEMLERARQARAIHGLPQLIARGPEGWAERKSRLIAKLKRNEKELSKILENPAMVESMSNPKTWRRRNKKGHAYGPDLPGNTNPESVALANFIRARSGQPPIALELPGESPMPKDWERYIDSRPDIADALRRALMEEKAAARSLEKAGGERRREREASAFGDLPLEDVKSILLTEAPYGEEVLKEKLDKAGDPVMNKNGEPIMEKVAQKHGGFVLSEQGSKLLRYLYGDDVPEHIRMAIGEGKVKQIGTTEEPPPASEYPRGRAKVPPPAAGKVEDARPEAYAGDTVMVPGRPSGSMVQPHALSEADWIGLAKQGRVHKAAGYFSSEEMWLANSGASWLRHGEAAGYSPADIVRFYIEGVGLNMGLEGKPMTPKVLREAFLKYRRDAAALGRDVSGMETGDAAGPDIPTGIEKVRRKFDPDTGEDPNEPPSAPPTAPVTPKPSPGAQAAGTGTPKRGKPGAAEYGQAPGEKALPTFGEPESVGRETQISVPGHVPVAARYAIVESGSVQTSHLFLDDGEVVRKRPGYPQKIQQRDYSKDPNEQSKVRDKIAGPGNMQPGLIISDVSSATDGPPIITTRGRVALGGNGRQMGTDLAYERGFAADYRTMLAERAAGYGLDPSVIEGMKRPVLVRLVDGIDPYSPEAVELSRRLNISRTMSQKSRDAAAATADIIDDSVLASVRLDGDESLSEMLRGSSTQAKGLRRIIYDSLEVAERNRYFEDPDTVNDAGAAFLRDVLVSKAIGRDIVREMPGHLIDSVERALPQLVALRGGDLPPELNLLPQLREALRFYSQELQGGKRTVDQYFEQDTFGFTEHTSLDPSVEPFVRFLAAKKGKKTAIREALKTYIDATKLWKKGSLFGGQKLNLQELAKGAFGVEFNPDVEFGDIQPPPPPGPSGEAGMAAWGGIPAKLRRALTRAHGGDARKARETLAYNTMAEMRPLLAEHFRAEVLEDTLGKLIGEGGVPPRAVELVKRLEMGDSVQDVREALYPDLTTPQFVAVATEAQAKALMAADSLAGKNALGVKNNIGMLRQVARDFFNIKTLFADEKPPEAPTFQRLKTVHEQERASKVVKAARKGRRAKLGGEGDVRTTGLAGFINRFRAIAGTTSQENENAWFEFEVKRRTRMSAFAKSLSNAEAKLERLGELSGGSGGKDIDGKKELSRAHVAVFHALDGLRRLYDGKEATRAQVEQFITDRAAEYDKLAPGAGKDFRNAVTIYRNLYNGIRNEYKRVYGRDIGPNIGEFMYAPHIKAPQMFSNEVSGGIARFSGLPFEFQDAIRSKRWSRFEQKRTGSTDYVPDIVNLSRMYFPGMLNKLALDSFMKPESPLHVIMHGERKNVAGDLRLKRSTRDGRITDTQAGREMVRELGHIAAHATNDNKELQLWVRASNIGKIRDIEGAPVGLPGMETRGGYYHFRRGKMPAVGDSSISLFEARGGKEFRVPFDQLRHFQWYRGGLQELATRQGMGGRLEMAKRLAHRMKITGQPNANGFLRVAEKVLLAPGRTLAYHNTLGLLQPSASINNYGGGMIMLAAHSGIDATMAAQIRMGRVMAGRSPKDQALLDKSGVIEQPELFAEHGLRRSPTGRVMQRINAISFAGFAGMERNLRGTAFFAGHKKFMDYSEKLVSALWNQHGIAHDESVLVARGNVFRDGKPIAGGERLAAILDGAKSHKPRKLSRDQITEELSEQGIVHGRAAVARTQFIYSAALTPEGFSGPIGRTVFQLNQYPIRAATAFFDAVKTEKDPKKVARWLAIYMAAGTAAHAMDWDLSPVLGLRLGDLTQSERWDQGGETLADKMKSWVADMHLPFPIPFSQGFPFLPTASIGMLTWEVARGALGLDPSNPLPTGDNTTADLWSRLSLQWQNARRSLKGAVRPTQWSDIYDYLKAPVDEQGRHLMKHRATEGYAYHPTPTDFWMKQIAPGSSEKYYDVIERGEVRRAEEQDYQKIRRQYADNEVAIRMGREEPQYTDFRRRQNAELLADNPRLKTVDIGSIKARLAAVHVSNEVESLAREDLLGRAKGTELWILNEKPGAQEFYDSMRILWGTTPRKAMPRFKKLGELGDEGKRLKKAMLGFWRKANKGRGGS